jgi:virginiamycin B lyase
MTHMKAPKILVMALSVAISAASAFAQDHVSLSGEVKDEKGRPMHGVLVSAKHDRKTVTVITKFDGKFTITELTPGPYAVRAMRDSFATVERRIDLPSSEALSFTLKPGAIDRSRLSQADMEKSLPDSPHKERLMSCQICHSWNGLGLQRPHRTQDWISGMNRMQKLGFGRFDPQDIPKMAEYLQTYFGAASTWQPTFPPEPIDEQGLNIKYMSFDIPTYHAMPHTAYPDGQGNVWFTEYGANKIGVVNVKTGKMEEFSIPSKIVTSPHNITRDRNGIVWFTEQTAGKIGRFDPSTKTFKEFTIPPPKNKPTGSGDLVQTEDANMRRPVAPHTLIPDGKGDIWFTSAANPLMKLDPETGNVTEYVIREGGGGLYGVTYDAKNNRIWYAGIGIGEVGYVDPNTGKIAHFPLLTPNAGPRRLHVDSKGVAWCNLYNVSKIARIDPSTGKVTEWNLPGGRNGLPYALGLDGKERVWTTTYRDDRLHMFDPRTEKFVSYSMPTKGNGMRDFYPDENGWVWAAAWGHNQVVGFKLEEDVRR